MIKPLVRIECKECSMFFKVPDIPAGLCAMRNAWTPADGGCMGSDDMKKTPDKVTVVRCKDCKWYEIAQLKQDGTDDHRYKPSYCTNLSYHTRQDFYCADGERRTKC